MKAKENNLTCLPNIGMNLAEKLMMVGIKSPNSLKSAGNENAYASKVSA